MTLYLYGTALFFWTFPPTEYHFQKLAFSTPQNAAVV